MALQYSILRVTDRQRQREREREREVDGNRLQTYSDYRATAKLNLVVHMTLAHWNSFGLLQPVGRYKHG